MPFMKFRPNLYRTVRVVLSDGSTFRQPSAVRQVGEMLAAARFTHSGRISFLDFKQFMSGAGAAAGGAGKTIRAHFNEADLQSYDDDLSDADALAAVAALSLAAS